MTQEPKKEDQANSEVQETEAQDASAALFQELGHLQEQLATLQTDLDAAKDQSIRARADLENYRKKAQREKDELRQLGQVRFIEELLPVVDNFRLGMASAQNHSSAKDIAMGLNMVFQQLEAFLFSHNVQVLDPTGERFDPQQHDCVKHEASEDVEADTIMQVVRVGYRMGERLLRPASVVVSSGPSKE